MAIKLRLRYKTRQTNYPKRLALLKCKKPRLVYRKTNTRLLAGFYVTEDLTKPDKCLMLFDSRNPLQRSNKNQQAKLQLVKKIVAYLKINPIDYVLDIRNKRQGMSFINLLNNELNSGT